MADFWHICDETWRPLRGKGNTMKTALRRIGALTCLFALAFFAAASTKAQEAAAQAPAAAAAAQSPAAGPANPAPAAPGASSPAPTPLPAPAITGPLQGIPQPRS